ncbi:MAG: hypothetical protein IJG80_03535 [Selenomonadaceae bacterium]|nr:hypothetical protein [Selenomonadaceae bacterium]
MKNKIASTQFLIPNSTFLIAVQPPQPPTAPAPAIRPTPPTPPRIDKTPFAKNSAAEVSDESPEAQAKDAVANGSGPLTKRTVERPDEPQAPAPAARRETESPVADTQSDYDRGQDVLREFREMDARESQSTYNPSTPASTEQRQPVVAKINYHEGHGGFFWIFTIIFVAVAALIVVKKFLFTGKPTLTKSQLFEDSTSRLKAVEEKVKPAPPPPPKPAKLPPKKNDDDKKGKHFEVRV